MKKTILFLATLTLVSSCCCSHGGGDGPGYHDHASAYAEGPDVIVEQPHYYNHHNRVYVEDR